MGHLLRRKVHCIHCGFLERSFIPYPGPPTAEDHKEYVREAAAYDRSKVTLPEYVSRAVEADTRKIIRDRQDNLLSLLSSTTNSLQCHRNLASFREGFQYGRRDPDVELWSVIATNITRPRECLGYFPYRPGYDPKAHLDLQHAAEKTRSDRWWDVVKIAGGFLLGVGTTLIGIIAKGWYDTFRAMRP